MIATDRIAAAVDSYAPVSLPRCPAVANLPGRRTLRSGGTSRLIVPSVRRSTVGDRAFSVAGPRVWNTAGGDNDIAVTPYFPSTAKNLALQEIISGHHYLNQNLFNFTINLEVALLLRQFLID